MAVMGSCREMRQSKERWSSRWKWKERSEESDRASMRSTQSGIGSGFEKIVLFVVALVMSVVVQPVTAQSMHSTSALQQGATASSQFAGSTLFFEWDGFLNSNPNNVLTFRASAIRLNDNWGAAPDHLFRQTGATYFNFRVGNGSNYLTDRGEVRQITQFFSHPLANPNGFNGDEVDLAVFRWDTALSGTNVSIAPAVLGEVLSYNGFGRPATPATGILPIDGQRRMYQTLADGFGTVGGAISTDYLSGFFRDAGPGFLPLGGVATAGVSGAGVYNQSGQLVALVSASAGSPGYLASTYSLRLEPHQPWIYSIVPSPGAASLLLLGGLFAARRRRG